MTMISVIIPAFNCANTIRSTVNSILKSGIPAFEIIIVDDGSNDSTYLICDTLAKEYACIHCIHQNNSGVSAARNRGLLEATGDYIWFVDADDSIDKDAMRRVCATLDKDTPDMLVFGMSFDYYHREKLFRRDEMLPPLEGLVHRVSCKGKMYDLYVTNSLSSLWSRIIKRSVILNADLKLREDMFLYEDLEFVLRVWKHCDSVCFVREALYRYRQARDGGNAGRRLMRVAHIPELIKKIEAVLEGEEDKNRILLSLHLTLAREKIAVASKADILTVCMDFKTWIDDRGLLPVIERREYPMMVYRGEVSKLLAKRTYSKIRHRTANWMKQIIGDFRKW